MSIFLSYSKLYLTKSIFCNFYIWNEVNSAKYSSNFITKGNVIILNINLIFLILYIILYIILCILLTGEHPFGMYATKGRGVSEFCTFLRIGLLFK